MEALHAGGADPAAGFGPGMVAYELGLAEQQIIFLKYRLKLRYIVS